MAGERRHYYIAKGTPCQVRELGQTAWRDHVTRKRLYFVERGEIDGLFVFVVDGWQLRVDPCRVIGPHSATLFDTTAAAPAAASGSPE